MTDATATEMNKDAPQRPDLLFGGLFTALASCGFALGTYPIFAPLCVFIVVIIGWFAPRENTQFATGAFAALVGILLFGALTLPLAVL